MIKLTKTEKVMLHTWIEKYQRSFLRKYAKKEGVSIAEIIRRSVDVLMGRTPKD